MPEIVVDKGGISPGHGAPVVKLNSVVKYRMPLCRKLLGDAKTPPLPLKANALGPLSPKVSFTPTITNVLVGVGTSQFARILLPPPTNSESGWQNGGCPGKTPNTSQPLPLPHWNTRPSPQLAKVIPMFDTTIDGGFEALFWTMGMNPYQATLGSC